MGARGPLSVKQTREVLKKAGVNGAELDSLQRHLAIEGEVAETPLVAGNRVAVLRNGENTFRAMFAAIRGAKSHINLEYYILENVESDGQKLSDLLLAKTHEGVGVNIIYDSYGSDNTAAAFFQTLKDGGANLVSFNPVNPLNAHGSYKPNDRDHRKILVADGGLGIVGGINLSTTYQSSGIGKSGGELEGKNGAPLPAQGAGAPQWHDTDLEIRGPVVAQLQTLFLEHWKSQKGPPLDEAGFFPKVAAMGPDVVRIIGSGPSHDLPRYYVTLLSAIRSAEKTIRMTAAYFVPTRQESEDLIDAARRGVDVRLLLPGQSDSRFSIAVQHGHNSALLKAGIKIYETQGVVLHSKSVVIDGVWSVVGSSNLDHRSVLFNDEVDAVVLSAGTASGLEKLFDAEVEHAQAIDPKVWRQRSFRHWMGDAAAKTWQSLL